MTTRLVLLLAGTREEGFFRDLVPRPCTRKMEDYWLQLYQKNFGDLLPVRSFRMLHVVAIETTLRSPRTLIPAFSSIKEFIDTTIDIDKIDKTIGALMVFILRPSKKAILAILDFLFETAQ